MFKDLNLAYWRKLEQIFWYFGYNWRWLTLKLEGWEHTPEDRKQENRKEGIQEQSRANRKELGANSRWGFDMWPLRLGISCCFS